MIAFLLFGLSALVMVTFLGVFLVVQRKLSIEKEEIERIWKGLDGLFRERFEELPKFVESAGPHLPEATVILRRLIDSKDRFFQSEDFSEKCRSDLFLSRVISDLLGRAQDNPELESNIHFVQIQERVIELEQRLEEKREQYHSAATAYNDRLKRPPDAFVANFLGYKSKPIYATSDVPPISLDPPYRASA